MQCRSHSKEECPLCEDTILPFKIHGECLTDKNHSVVIPRQIKSFYSGTNSVTKCNNCCGGSWYKENVQYQESEYCSGYDSSSDSARHIADDKVRSTSSLNLCRLQSRSCITTPQAGPCILSRDILRFLRLNKPSNEHLVSPIFPWRHKYSKAQEDPAYLNLRCKEILRGLSKNLYCNYPTEEQVFCVTRGNDKIRIRLCSKCRNISLDTGIMSTEGAVKNKKLNNVKPRVNSGRKKKMKVDRDSVDRKKQKSKPVVDAPKKETQRVSRPKTRRNLNDIPHQPKTKSRCHSNKSTSSKERSAGSVRKPKRPRTPSAQRSRSSKSGGSQSSRHSSQSNQAAGDSRTTSLERSTTHGVESIIKDSVNEHEYLQFALRITEDIIKNDLYSCNEMRRVFNSHIEANRGRLDINKMKEQVRNLAKELNVKYDETAVYTLGPSNWENTCIFNKDDNTYCKLIYVAKDVTDTENINFSRSQRCQCKSIPCISIAYCTQESSTTPALLSLNNKSCECMKVPSENTNVPNDPSTATEKPDFQNRIKPSLQNKTGQKTEETESHDTQITMDSSGKIQDVKTQNDTDHESIEKVWKMDFATSLSDQQISALSEDNFSAVSKPEKISELAEKSPELLEQHAASPQIRYNECLKGLKLEEGTKKSIMKSLVPHATPVTETKNCHFKPTAMVLMQITPERGHLNQQKRYTKTAELSTSYFEPTNLQIAVNDDIVGNVCGEKAGHIEKFSSNELHQTIASKEKVTQIKVKKAKQEHLTATTMQIADINDKKLSIKEKKITKDKVSPKLAICPCPCCTKARQNDTIWNETDEIYKDNCQDFQVPPKIDSKSQIEKAKCEDSNPTQKSTNVEKKILVDEQTQNAPSDVSTKLPDISASNGTDIDLQPEKQKKCICDRHNCFRDYTITDKYSYREKLPDVLARFFPSSSTQTTSSDLLIIDAVLKVKREEIKEKYHNKRQEYSKKTETREKDELRQMKGIVETDKIERLEQVTIMETKQGVERNENHDITAKEDMRKGESVQKCTGITDDGRIQVKANESHVSSQTGPCAESISTTIAHSVLQLSKSQQMRDSSLQLVDSAETQKLIESLSGITQPQTDCDRVSSSKVPTSTDIINSFKNIKDQNTKKDKKPSEKDDDSVYDYFPMGGRKISQSSVPILVSDHTIVPSKNGDLLEKKSDSKETIAKKQSDINDLMKKLDHQPQLSVTRSMDRRVKKMITSGELFRHPDIRRIGFESHSGIDLNLEQTIMDLTTIKQTERDSDSYKTES